MYECTNPSMHLPSLRVLAESPGVETGRLNPPSAKQGKNPHTTGEDQPSEARPVMTTSSKERCEMYKQRPKHVSRTFALNMHSDPGRPPWMTDTLWPLSENFGLCLG